LRLDYTQRVSLRLFHRRAGTLNFGSRYRNIRGTEDFSNLCLGSFSLLDLLVAGKPPFVAGGFCLLYLLCCGFVPSAFVSSS